jgi:NADH:ubiquinone oxidoreductase subunit E
MRKMLIKILAKHVDTQGSLISLLQDTQDAFGYLPKEAVYWYSEELYIPASRFFGIATFYAQFHLKPRGKNIITACCGTACHVRGAERIINAVQRELNLDDLNDTTDDGEFTLEKPACIGACSLAPVVLINGKPKGKANADVITREIRALKKGGKKDND